MTQEQALETLKDGNSVFLTGAPGAGKTYVLNQYLDWLKSEGVGVAVTASTGIAATHIGGTTIHSWSGIGIRKELSEWDLEMMLEKESLYKRVNWPDVLVVDEISMLSGEFLDMVDQVCRAVRQDEQPFGGLQVVLVGDFFQLPPISRSGESIQYAFQSDAWKELDPKVCYLETQFRQEDEVFLQILTALREGLVSDAIWQHFRITYTQDFPEGVEPTRLYTHNADVDSVNQQRLDQIITKSHTFTMTGKGNKKLLDRLYASCLSPEMLELKVGAVVMFTKNNFEGGYVNGTMGVVTDFEEETGYPIVETYDEKEITVHPVSWEMIDEGKVLASISQIPLRLAWAITVHKSQGMSLDAVEVDLSQCFTYGQGYVALSRARSLSGLRVLGLNEMALQVDPVIREYDEVFRQGSRDQAGRDEDS